MTEVFFFATQKALSNITSVFDFVWPTAAAMWNFRRLISDEYAADPTITNAQLMEKFYLESRIHGANCKRAFIEQTWEKQQSIFAWILLNNTISIYEGWLEDLKNIFPSMKEKNMQFPDSVKAEVSLLTTCKSVTLERCFYAGYSSKRDRHYSDIEALMHCYRIFKEARNCYMHAGSKASQRLIDAYTDYLPFSKKEKLHVTEVPEFPRPSLNAPIEISLRGVVGFSYILIKILVSLDTELLCSSRAEAEFRSRYKETHSIACVLKADPVKAAQKVARLVRKCGFITPENADEMRQYLLTQHLVTL